MVTDGRCISIPLGDAGVGGQETDGDGGEKGPDPPEWQKIAGIPDCWSQDADLEPWEGGKAEARGSAEPGIAEQLLSYRL